jgi:hypothetical protein
MSATDHAPQIVQPLSAVGYHGTTCGGFAALRPHIRRGEQLGFGIHLAADYEFASRYAFDPLVARKGGNSPCVVVGIVRMNRPLYAARSVEDGTPEFALAKKLAGSKLMTVKNDHGVACCWLQNAIDAAAPERAQKLIEEAGYDGVVYRARVGTRGVNARYTAESLSYLVMRSDQVTILENRNERRARPTQRIISPANIVSDEGDTDNALCANFGVGESHMRYTMDASGDIRLLGIWRDRDSDDGIRGTDMVAWLKMAYGRRIIVDEVAPTAVGFWERMLAQKLIARYSDRPFSGAAQLPPAPAPMHDGRKLFLDDTGRPQHFYLISQGARERVLAPTSGEVESELPTFSPSPVVALVFSSLRAQSGNGDGEGGVVGEACLAMNRPLKLSAPGVNLGLLAKKLCVGMPGGVAREALFEIVADLASAAEKQGKDQVGIRVKSRRDLPGVVDDFMRLLCARDVDGFDMMLASVLVQAPSLVACPVFTTALKEIGYDGVIYRQQFEHGSRMAVLLAGQQIAPEHINEKREVWMYRPLSRSQVANVAELDLLAAEGRIAVSEPKDVDVRRPAPAR